MRRREFVLLLGGMMTGARALRAQQKEASNRLLVGGGATGIVGLDERSSADPFKFGGHEYQFGSERGAAGLPAARGLTGD